MTPIKTNLKQKNFIIFSNKGCQKFFLKELQLLKRNSFLLNLEINLSSKREDE